MLKLKKPCPKDILFLTVTLLLVGATITLSVLLCGAYRRAEAAEALTEMPFFDYYKAKCHAYGMENANYAKEQIVFIGDSITDGYILDDAFGDLPLATYNRGIGGDTTAGVLARLDTSLFEIAPSKIVLMIGTNDVGLGEKTADILARYEDIVKEIRRELPGTALYCMSIIPQHETESISAQRVASATAHIMELNPKIKALAEKHGATFVDIFGALADTENHLRLDYSGDGIHLNTEGYAVWTAHIKPYLQ